jgi:membrane protein implicated in regulation of membrane protease activity
MTLTLAYLILVVLGTGYIVVTALLGHLVDAFHDAQAGIGGGHDAGAYGVDGSGHGSVSAGDGGAFDFHFPLFSPLALATLFATIGAYGLIAKQGFEIDGLKSLLIALPAAFATSYATLYVAARIVNSSRATSTVQTHQFAGAVGEVITPIPESGLGEVAAIVDGQRHTMAARTLDGKPIGRGRSARVVRLQGSTLLVEPVE